MAKSPPTGDGKWNSVFYVCHDPAVVVRHSDDLGNDGFIDIADARISPDKTLSEFAAGLPDHFVVADLRNKPNGAGFAWDKFRKRFFSRLFGR